MVLSKGKKIILIVLAVVIVLVGGYFAYRSYSETQYRIDRAINSVLDADSAFSFADPYDAETASDFIEEYWNPVKDKSRFQKELVNRLEEEIIQVSLHNLEESRADKEEPQYIENQYGSQSVGAHDTFKQLSGFLKQVGYQDEALRDSIFGYYQRLAETKRTAAPKLADQPESEQALSVAEGLANVREQVGAVNEAADEFYQIAADEIVTVEEISGDYDQVIQRAYDAGDVEIFVEALSNVTGSPALEYQPSLPSEQIADFLMDDSGEVYTLRNGVGGYYDTNRDSDSGKSITYYGDFARRTTVSGGNRYDTSGLAGVWGALTPGQRAEIRSGNRTHTYHYRYLRGEDYKGNVDPTLAEDGYGYVYVGNDGTALYFSSRSISYVGNADFGNAVIYGDFADICADMESSYRSGRSVPDWASSEANSTAVTDE